MGGGRLWFGCGLHLWGQDEAAGKHWRWQVMEERFGPLQICQLGTAHRAIAEMRLKLVTLVLVKFVIQQRGELLALLFPMMLRMLHHGLSNPYQAAS